MAISRYICEHPDLFQNLKDNHFFNEFVKYQYDSSLSKTRIKPYISEYSCNLAYARFKEDCGRMHATELDGIGDLDHFKQVSFLVFWLRRFSPVYDVTVETPDTTTRVRVRSEAPKEVEYFFLNQNISFDIGFRILRYWESMREDSAEIYGRQVDVFDFKGLGDEIRYKPLLKDLIRTLATKSISPHAIWMIYRTLFHQLLPPTRRRWMRTS